MSKADELFDLIWETDMGLGNIIVNDFSMDTLFEFVQRWQRDVVDGGDKAAADDMRRSVSVCPEVSGFSSIEGTIPLTFSHCVIRNNVAYHKDIFKGFEKEIEQARADSTPKSNDATAFFACLESTAALPLAKYDGAGRVDTIYTANNWVWAFRSAVQRLVATMVRSKQFDKDLRLIIPVIGLEFSYTEYEEILRTISETSLQDRVCYVVFAEKEEIFQQLVHSVGEFSSEENAVKTARRLFDTTFSHEIE